MAWAGAFLLVPVLVLKILMHPRAVACERITRAQDGSFVLIDREERVLLDPWKRPYVFLEASADHPRARVVSYGADGRPGGEGENADIDSEELLKEAR